MLFQKLDSENKDASDNSQTPDGFVQKSVQSGVENPNRMRIINANLTPLGPEAMKKTFYQGNKIYFWAIGLGVVILGTLAFLAFRGPEQAAVAEAKVGLAIEAPQNVPSGGEVIYKIKVENQDTQSLVGLSLELAYPNGFSYISSSPNAENLSGSLFKVPDLIPGQNVALIVKVRATGSINDTKDLVAKLHYRYSNFNSEFVKQQSLAVRLVASDIVMELVAPQQANNSQLMIYTLKYRNNSQQEIKNARIRLVYPDGFQFAASNPQPDLGNNIWSVPQLAIGAEGDISIQGTFKSINPGESKVATAEFLILGDGGDFYVQSTASAATGISSLPLLITQEVMSKSDGGAVNPGEEITVSIRYQNNASTVAEGVNLQATIDSQAVDFSSVQAEGAVVNNNVIFWNAASVSQLERLAPNESGEVKFNIKVKDPATRDSSKHLTVVSKVSIKANGYETSFPGNDLTLKISSPSELSSVLDHVDGSLPPRVGQNTTYRVSLMLKNSTNDFSDTIVTAFIPLGVGGYQEGSASSRDVAYDPATGKLTWNAGSLPAHTGQFSPAKTLTFQVRLNPAASQAGGSPTLVKDIKYQAKDLFTGQEISGDIKEITTASISGQNSYNQGRVQP